MRRFGTSARRSSLRDGLIVVQVAVSVLLLAGSGLLVRSFLTLHRGPGFDPDAVVLMRLRPSLLGYTSERAWRFQREVDSRARSPARRGRRESREHPSAPWMEPATAAHPTRGRRRAIRSAPSEAATTHVGPRYFTALGVGLVQGREFDDRDTPTGPRVAIVNETLARHLWPQGGAVGSVVTIGGRPGEIVGIVKDAQFVSVRGHAEPIAYLDFWQQDAAANLSHDSFAHVRVLGDAAAMLPAMRRAIAAIDPDVPVIGRAAAWQLVSTTRSPIFVRRGRCW